MHIFRTMLPVLAVVCATPAFAETVTVVPGDTLSRIANKYLGAGDRWTELCELNRDVVGDNCNRVVVGAKLKLPEAPAAAAVVAPTPATKPAAVAAAPAVEMTPVAISELEPELVTVTKSSEMHDDLSVFSATVQAEPGQRRVRYVLGDATGKTYDVTWKFHYPAAAADPAILIFDNANKSYGDIRLSLTGKPKASHTGAVASAKVEKLGDGWYQVAFRFTGMADGAKTQLLLYPSGSATTALAAPFPFEFTVPQVVPAS